MPSDPSLLPSACPKSLIQEVVVASGVRICTPLTTTSLLRASQSRVVYIIPVESAFVRADGCIVHIIPVGGAFVRADGQSLPGTSMLPAEGNLSGKGRMVHPIEEPLPGTNMGVFEEDEGDIRENTDEDGVDVYIREIDWDQCSMGVFEEDDEGDIRESIDEDEVDMDIREIDWGQCNMGVFKEDVEGDIRESTDEDEVDIREIDWDQCNMGVFEEDVEGDTRESTYEDEVESTDEDEVDKEVVEKSIRRLGRTVEGSVWSSNFKGERSDGPCKQANKLQQSAEGMSSLFASDQEGIAAPQTCSLENMLASGVKL